MSSIKFTIVIVFFTLKLVEMKSDRKITVLISQTKPFAFRENGVFKGLDVNIVENFAEKYKLKIRYIVATESLNELFSTERDFENDTKAMRYSWVALQIPEFELSLLRNWINCSVADILIGALDENLLTKKYFTSSISYYHDHLVWCVQKAKLIPLWKAVFLICTDWMVYVAFTVLCIVLGFIAYFFQQVERHQKYDIFRITSNGLQCFFGFGYPYRVNNLSLFSSNGYKNQIDVNFSEISSKIYLILM